MNLRARTIRLAHANPALRPHLLPLLKTAAPDPAMLERMLDSLLTEDEVVNKSLEGFESHFKTASEALLTMRKAVEKALESVKKAEAVVKAITALVAMDPENKDHEALQKKAEKVLATLVKTHERARKDYHVEITKVLPTELKKAADKLEKAMRSRLVDPNLLVRKLEYGTYSRADSPYNVSLIIQATREEEDDWNGKKVTRPAPQGVRLTDSLDGKGIIAMTEYGGSPGHEKMTPEAAWDKVQANLRAWPGLKGGADAAKDRQALFEQIGPALYRAAYLLGDASGDKARLQGNRISVSYRSGLPKEGDHGIDEYRYEDMVNREMARAKKTVDELLTPFKGKFEKVNIHLEEKGYVSMDVELK